MIILLHILIALSSLAQTTYTFFRPTQAALRASYSLAAATVLSGSYLVLSTRTHLIEACTMGLAYLGLVATGIIFARRKLADTAG